jgi:hypothetical protein
MATESVGLISEASNVLSVRTVKPVPGTTSNRSASLTLGQLASRAANEDPIDWNFSASQGLDSQAVDTAVVDAAAVDAPTDYASVLDASVLDAPALNAPALGASALGDHAADVQALSFGVNQSRRSVEIMPLPNALYRGEPAATVQASADELEAIDLFLNDPLNSRLIELLSPGPVSASSEFSQQLIERFGEQRFARMKRLQEAHERARDQFRDAINAARLNPPLYLSSYPSLAGDGAPGWKTVLTPIYESGGEAGPLFRGFATQWEFDSVAFANWYGRQAGVSNQVFAAMYGHGAAQIDPPTDWHPDYEFIGRPHKILMLGNGAWTFDLDVGILKSTGSLRAMHSEEVDLINPDAIQFDPLLGLSAATANFREERDWGSDVIQVLSAVAIAYIAAQTGGAAAGGFAEGSAAGAIAAGAAASATGATLNGLANDQFDLKNIFRAALSGALTSGISQLPLGEGGDTLANLGYRELSFGEVAIDGSFRAISIAGQATLRGLLTDALGGKFQEGIKQGVLQLIATEFTRGVGQYVKDHHITGTDARAIHYLGQTASSAIRIVGSQSNPMHSTAQTLLESLLGDVAKVGSTQAPNSPLGNSTAVPVTVVMPVSNAIPELNVIPVTTVATVAPALGAPVYDVVPLDTPAASEPLSAPAEPVDSTSIESGPTSSGESPARSFAGELDVPYPAASEPNTHDSSTGADGEEPTQLARNSASGTRTDSQEGEARNMVPVRSLNGVPTPPLDPISGQPVELRWVGPGPNQMPMWIPIPPQSEEDIAELIRKQSRAEVDPSVKLTIRDELRLEAINWIKRERAMSAGASEGDGFATDARGNVRVFELNGQGQPYLKPGERLVTTHYYKAAGGEIVYVDNLQSIPPGVDPTHIRMAQSHYYGETLIARDFRVPSEYFQSVEAHAIAAGDSITAIRRQVSVPPTGPFAELAKYIDKGSGQVNPLQWEEFKARATEIAIAQGTPVRMVVTSNGMVNSYQQANANAVQLASGIPNAIVVNVLNPSSGSYFSDGLEALRGKLGVQQTVSASIAAQILEARGFQDGIHLELNKGSVKYDEVNILVVAHSQGTINLNQALASLKDRSLLSKIDGMYVGTAVNRLPTGLANVLNVTDTNDPVATIWTSGSTAVVNTFEVVPSNYRQVTTNFNAERASGLVLPTGNNHSLHLYLMRPEVQGVLADILKVDAIRFAPRFAPPYTQSPETRTDG